MGDIDAELGRAVSALRDIDTDVSSGTLEGTRDNGSVEIPYGKFGFRYMLNEGVLKGAS